MPSKGLSTALESSDVRVNEMSVHRPALEGRVPKHLQQEQLVRCKPCNNGLAKRPLHLLNGGLARVAMCDLRRKFSNNTADRIIGKHNEYLRSGAQTASYHFGNQRIVVNRDVRAADHARVIAYTPGAALLPLMNTTNTGEEVVVRILRVSASIASKGYC